MPTTSASLESAFVESWLADQWGDVHVVLAVSGGADSVAMLRLAIAAKRRVGGSGRLHVAHLNHGIRPADAADDAAWVAGLCQRLEIHCKIGSADVPALAARQGDGLEAAARTARYDFLREVAERLGARWVAVAHTADDQVETVLQRLLRGTSVAGLAGMSRFRPLSPAVQLVRPLLGVWRGELLKYLAEMEQPYRTDVTNEDRRLTRNRLRHELLPLLRADYNSDVDAALVRLAEQAGETQALLASLAEPLVVRAVTVEPGRLLLNRRLLAAESPLLVREACKWAWHLAGWPLQNMGYHEWHELQQLITSTKSRGSLNLPESVRAELHESHVLITRVS